MPAGMFAVGPESVGATPGPVCYSKGGSTLAITDCNVVLGRIQAAYFPAIFGPDVCGRYREGTCVRMRLWSALCMWLWSALCVCW